MTEAGTAGASVLEAPDGRSIPLTIRVPVEEDTPVAVVQVLHGLSEHLGRYDRFAQTCRGAGFAVVGHNHRGHGPHTGTPGHFADRDGWNKVVGDAIAVGRFARRRWPDRPLVLFGHSMGSYIAQSAMAREPDIYSGLVLSGSTWSARRRVRTGRWLARLAILFQGGRHASPLLHKLGFESFNRRFTPARTEVDWLTRDPGEVDRYVADPLCGISISNRLWHDLLGGLLEITSLRTLQLIPHDLPILITGGADDPAGGRRGMTRLAAAYEQTGHERVISSVWPNGRHEMLNEVEREAFTAYVLEWMATVTR